MNTKFINRTAIVAAATWVVIGVTPSTTLAQQNVQRSEAIASSAVLSQIPMFSYKENAKSQLLFRGTPVAGAAEGSARVEFEKGNARISAKVADLPKPASLGAYTTYVLWAVTPDGRAANKGILSGSLGGKGQIDTQHGTSQFALIVTAEPHFAVTVPSKMMVLYNVADNVKGGESKLMTLTESADYSHLSAVAIDKTTPVELVQARYAVAIARDAGAERFATAAFATATEKLGAAERGLKGTSSERKSALGIAREAVVAGEDARRASLLASAAAKIEEDRLAAAAAAEQAARQAANDSDETARQVAAVSAETARQAAAVSNETARQVAAVSSETARQAANAASDAAASAAKVAAESAAAAAARDDLRNRLNAALPTRESTRGLISEIGGLQFATGAATLNESARSNLSRFSGIVASYPSMRFNIEGHTDSTGSIATNNALSLQRAVAVRDYLISKGVSPTAIEVAGMGSSSPIADNTTADARSRNRRVEIVVSGGPLTASN